MLDGIYSNYLHSTQKTIGLISILYDGKIRSL